MRSSDRQILVPAILASVLIHAVLLVSVVVLVPVRNEPMASSIDVTMKRVAPPADAVQAVREPGTTVPSPAPKAATVPVRDTVAPIITVADQMAESSVPAASPVQAAQSARETVGASSSPIESGRGSALRTESAAAESVNADDVSDLRRYVMVATRRFKSYPHLAKERGWEGVVDIALVYKANAVYPEVSVTHSSGRTILDEQALEMVGRAARATPVPASLRGHNFGISLPIKFSLDDE